MLSRYSAARAGKLLRSGFLQETGEPPGEEDNEEDRGLVQQVDRQGMPPQEADLVPWEKETSGTSSLLLPPG